jgi:glyoxylase-like metal-dependent hydrolase (beta-lactamase superfamily II)/ketosteroid isomerase-like protein
MAEATAEIQQTKPKRSTKAETAKAVRNYFEAIERGDRNAQAEAYAPEGTAQLHGVFEGGRPEIIEYFRALWAAFPDFKLRIVDLVVDGDRAAVHWRVTATFTGPASFQGVEPNGAPLELEGVDFVRVEDGKIVRNDAFPDNLSLARGIGMLPPAGSKSDQRMTAAFNAKTRIANRLVSAEPERVADGVWVLRGGFPGKTMNVYMISDGDGVMLFDAGVRSMTNQVAAAGASLGGITRIVLGHGHADHRGVAPALHVPVVCHPDARGDAEGDGGEHYFDFSKLNPVGRFLLPRMLRSWDGGPVSISDTLSEGDEIAGFRVVDLPGHAPGLIGLWRESDRLALSSDTFYTLDPQTGRKGHPRVPHQAFNQDTELARASIRKLAALEPAAAWPGHADPVVGDVRGQLEQAAATT